MEALKVTIMYIHPVDGAIVCLEEEVSNSELMERSKIRSSWHGREEKVYEYCTMRVTDKLQEEGVVDILLLDKAKSSIVCTEGEYYGDSSFIYSLAKQCFSMKEEISELHLTVSQLEKKVEYLKEEQQ